MQTGDLEFELNQESIAEAVDRVSSVHTIEEEKLISGCFRGATLDTWHFDFRADDGSSITGRLNEEL